MLPGKKLPMAQQEGHRSMCQASSLAAKFFFVKNNIKVNQLVNGWVANCNDVCTQITTLPSIQLQKGKLKKEKKKKRDVCQEGVSPYHKFTKLNSLTGNISPAIHVCYRINGTRVEEGTSRQRERVCI